MLRWSLTGVAAIAVLASSGSAGAEPVAPQTLPPCQSNLSNAMTWPTGAETPLVCTSGEWQPVADPYPYSDRWLSYGPPMTLHGEGRRNPTLASGSWTATPLTPEDQCSATQLAVIPGSPTTGAPQADQGVTGAPLSLQVVPRLFSIEMRGDCLWQRLA